MKGGIGGRKVKRTSIGKGTSTKLGSIGVVDLRAEPENTVEVDPSLIPKVESIIAEKEEREDIEIVHLLINMRKGGIRK